MAINYSKKFREKILNQEKENTERHVFLRPDQVDEFNCNLGGSNYYRIFFDFPLKEALMQGYKISVKGYFESTDSPIIEFTALRVRELLTNISGDTGIFDIADLFTGAGQAAYAFAKIGFIVTTIELDQNTFMYARENIIKSGISVSSHCGDATTFLSEAKINDRQFSTIFVDPPWNGNYLYNIKEPFYFSDTEPNAEELIRKSIPLAQIVVFKAPINIDNKQVEDLANKLNCKAIIQYQYIPNYKLEHNNAMVYFIRNNKGFSVEHVTIPIIKHRGK